MDRRLSVYSCLLCGLLFLAGAGVQRPLQAQEGPGGIPRPRAEARAGSLESDHFHIVFDPARLTPADVGRARDQAETAWSKCARLFGQEPSAKLRLDLTPDFVGATGFAMLGNEDGRPGARPMIGVRYADLEYLGLAGDYVLTHEIGHIFSGKLAGSSLGEGIADWAAGSFSGVPMRPWWGRALRQAGIWVEPRAFFVSGDFEQSREVDATIRTAQYAESALLVQFLVERFGWEKTRRFAEEFSQARGRLESNAERRLRRPERPSTAGGRDPRRAPDAAEVSAVFEHHFGVPADKMLTDWQQWIDAEPVPAPEGERLILAEKIYGAIRNYEMWTLAQKPGPSAEVRALIRAAFTDANRSLAAGDLSAARTAFARASRIVERLRRPVSVAMRGREQPSVRGRSLTGVVRLAGW
ncbi:MAG TPA: hypothetical protein VFU47_17560 [Armatimonadota bacterium]|nr:hypothetical protein [Armatimonadota bacterium]